MSRTNNNMNKLYKYYIINFNKLIDGNNRLLMLGSLCRKGGELTRFVIDCQSRACL